MPYKIDKDLRLCMALGCGLSMLATSVHAAITEVIVTAQKYEENIQTVPLAISAMTSEELGNQGITSFDGVAKASPSISFTPYPSSANTLILYMRGQGLDDPGQITRDGAVGLYADGFYIARPQASTFDLADVERVEILRGPQGTLYGRNTTGGAINLISKQPTGQFGFKQDFTFGTRNLFRSLTTVNLPQYLDVSTKLTLLKSSIDGFVKNAGSGRDFQEQEQRAGRFSLHWEGPKDVIVDYFMEKGNLDSTPPYWEDPIYNGQFLFDANTPYYAKPDGPMTRSYRAVDLKLSTSNFEGHGLTLSWDVTDAFSIKSLTGYRKLYFDSHQDYAEGFGVPYATEDLYHEHQFSQEFQFIGSLLDGSINYVAGLYYFDEGGWHQSDADVGAGAFLKSQVVRAESKSRAAYGQITWAPEILGGNLDFTAGARYTRDRKLAERFASNNFDGVVESGAATGTENSQEFSRFNPSFTVNYKWTEDVSTYAKVSTAYKAGGSLESEPVGQFNSTFGPENITNYEVGLKSYLFDHRLRANFAAFDSRYRDIQIAVPIDINNQTYNAYNAGKATIKGLEAELLYVPVDDFTVNLNYSYLWSRVQKVSVIAGTVFDPATNPSSPYQVGENIKGSFTVPYTPKHSINLGTDYTFLHFDGGDLSAHLDYRWESHYSLNPVDGPEVTGHRYDQLHTGQGLVNGRLTMALNLPRGDHAKVGIWAKNIFHKEYDQYGGGRGGGAFTFVPGPNGNNVPAGYTSHNSIWAEPASYGIDLNYEY